MASLTVTLLQESWLHGLPLCLWAGVYLECWPGRFWDQEARGSAVCDLGTGGQIIRGRQRGSSRIGCGVRRGSGCATAHQEHPNEGTVFHGALGGGGFERWGRRSTLLQRSRACSPSVSRHNHPHAMGSETARRSRMRSRESGAGMSERVDRSISRLWVLV